MMDIATVTDLLWLALAFAGVYGFGCLFCWIADGLGEANGGTQK